MKQKMKKIFFDVLVTENQVLKEYLKEQDYIDDNTVILDKATEKDIAGKRVCGDIPFDLFGKTALCSIVKLEIIKKTIGEIKGIRTPEDVFNNKEVITMLFKDTPVVFFKNEHLDLPQGLYMCKNIEYANEFYKQFWKE